MTHDTTAAAAQQHAAHSKSDVVPAAQSAMKVCACFWTFGAELGWRASLCTMCATKSLGVMADKSHFSTCRIMDSMSCNRKQTEGQVTARATLASRIQSTPHSILINESNYHHAYTQHLFPKAQFPLKAAS